MESSSTGLLPRFPIQLAVTDLCASYSKTPLLPIFHALPARSGHQLPIVMGTLTLFAIFLLFIRQWKRSKVSVTH